MCKCDVPRNANGWPTVGPEHFTERQLRLEAESWRPSAMSTSSVTVSYAEWEKYATELHRRGFIKEVDVKMALVEAPKTEEPPVVEATPPVSFWKGFWSSLGWSSEPRIEQDGSHSGASSTGATRNLRRTAVNTAVFVATRF
jgi:hypothetical protein